MKINNYKKLALTGISTAILTACSSGGTCGSCAVPVPIEGSKLIFVSPSILPSLANVRGVNYMGLYNPTNTAISNISYSLGQIVGSGSSVTLDQNSAKACANIAAKSSCFLKLLVPESTIAGGAVVTASNSDGTEAATPLAIGVQQVPYTESANANGVGLYFYPKAQYSESGVPFMLATAVVQSPNVGNINTIELVDESGNLITGQYVTSGNSGAGAAQLTMGSVVQIVVPLPQGVNLSQNYKVRTSYQSAPSVLSTIAEKLGLVNKQTQATSNQTTGSQIYTVTTQSNNINLQFTPNQIYLTGTNPVQYGYLYNIGDLTASQIKVSSSSSNVRITAANTTLDGQRVIKVTYELINSTVAPATNLVTVTAQNPAGQTQTSTGGTNQNVNPLPVPTPSPTPTPTPTPSPNINYYAFIAEEESGVLYCPVKENNGTITTCSVESVPSAPNLWRPTGLSFTTVNGSLLLYVVDSSDNNQVWKCTVNNDGSFNRCSAAYDYTSTRGIGSYYQISFAWVNGVHYSYMADSSTWINKCTVENDGTLDNCTQYYLAISTFGALQAYGVTVESVGNSQYAYITDIHTLGDSCHLFKCSITNDGGIQDDCVATSNGSGEWCPRTTTFSTYNNVQYAYVSEIPQNGDSGNIYQCTLNNQDGTFNSCLTTPTSPPNWFPYMTAFISDNTPFIYSISRQTNNTGNNDVYSCSVNLTTGLIVPATCNVQQSNSSVNNAADAIVIQRFASN